MSSHGVDVSQLSDSERTALDTYTAVTGQEPTAAIPLLRRSEWNVQIAVSKFFDGEGPDPIEEALRSPPPQPNRRVQNLMNDDVLQSLSSARRAVEPAPRVSTQPEDHPVYRPPFLLALLFSPFNLLYRLLHGSLHLFGAIFPFLPRLFSTTAVPGLNSMIRSNTGRRPLGPKDAAARFTREFEEQYGINNIPFLEVGYNMSLEKSHRDLKLLLVVLLSPEHDDTNGWVRETLLSQEVTEFINDPQNGLLVWGGNIRDSEAYQVSNSLRCTKFPFAALIAHTPSVSSTAMSVVSRISGATSPSEFVDKLRSAVSQNCGPLERVRTQRTQQQASRSLREEQDSAYERSLAIDRERARQMREAEEARQREEQQAAERQAVEERRKRGFEQWKRWRAQSITEEPEADVKDAVRISIRLPSGDRVVRRFRPETALEELYAFVECYDVLQEPHGTMTIEKPEGFEHQYSFRLVSPVPRAVYEADAGGSIRDKIGRGGNLLVEPIDDDNDEEE